MTSLPPGSSTSWKNGSTRGGESRRGESRPESGEARANWTSCPPGRRRSRPSRRARCTGRERQWRSRTASAHTTETKPRRTAAPAATGQSLTCPAHRPAPPAPPNGGETGTLRIRAFTRMVSPDTSTSLRKVITAAASRERAELSAAVEARVRAFSSARPSATRVSSTDDTAPTERRARTRAGWLPVPRRPRRRSRAEGRPWARQRRRRRRARHEPSHQACGEASRALGTGGRGPFASAGGHERPLGRAELAGRPRVGGLRPSHASAKKRGPRHPAERPLVDDFRGHAARDLARAAASAARARSSRPPQRRGEGRREGHARLRAIAREHGHLGRSRSGRRPLRGGGWSLQLRPQGGLVHLGLQADCNPVHLALFSVL